MGLLLPLAGALAAVLMAMAIRCKTFKEAQANATVVVLGVSLLPLVTIFNQEGQAPWHLWVPALAQTTLMGRVLRGEALPWADVVVAAGVCVLLAAVAIVYRRPHPAHGGAEVGRGPRLPFVGRSRSCRRAANAAGQLGVVWHSSNVSQVSACSLELAAHLG